MASEAEPGIRPCAVAVYVRWSTEEQGEGTTLREQLERCKSYVLSQGWQVNDDLVFVDDGYSGATLHRPAMARMRQLIGQGQIDCVVSLKIDRLSRSLVDCVDLVLKEWAGVCHYKSVSQPVNTTDELSRVFFAILAGFAEYERALIRERTFSGLLRRVREGHFWGSGKAPYGYSRLSRGKLGVNEQEAAVVRLIFAMVAQDALGPAAVAARLNSLGVPGPEGKGWWPNTVRQIVRNRIYCGWPAYGKRYVDPQAKAGGRRVLRRREAPLVEAAERVPALAIVTEETFRAVQRTLAEAAALASRQGTRAKTSHLLTGIARCRCGGPMVTGRDRLGRRYYFCQRRDLARGGRSCPAAGGFVYAERLEPAVAEAVRRRYADREAILRCMREQSAQRQHRDAAGAAIYQRALAEVRRREQKLQQDLARVMRQARRGEITLAEKRAFEQDVEAERQELAQRRLGLQRSLAEMQAARAREGELEAWVSGVDLWSELSPAAQKEVLRRLLDRVVLHKPRGRGKALEADFYWRA